MVQLYSTLSLFSISFVKRKKLDSFIHHSNTRGGDENASFVVVESCSSPPPQENGLYRLAGLLGITKLLLSTNELTELNAMIEGVLFNPLNVNPTNSQTHSNNSTAFAKELFNCD